MREIRRKPQKREQLHNHSRRGRKRITLLLSRRKQTIVKREGLSRRVTGAHNGGRSATGDRNFSVAEFFLDSERQQKEGERAAKRKFPSGKTIIVRVKFSFPTEQLSTQLHISLFGSEIKKKYLALGA